MEAFAAQARAIDGDRDTVEMITLANGVALYHLGEGQLPRALDALDRAMDVLRAAGGAQDWTGRWALLRTVVDADGTQARDECRRLSFDTAMSRATLRAADAVAAGRRAGTRHRSCPCLPPSCSAFRTPPPPNSPTSTCPARKGPAPQRTSDWLEAHHDQPVGVADLAAAMGLSVRRVQAICRRRWNQTPMQLLRGIRLDHARRVLLAASPGGAAPPITAVASAAGFTRTTRFNAAYRQRRPDPRPDPIPRAESAPRCRASYSCLAPR